MAPATVSVLRPAAKEPEVYDIGTIETDIPAEWQGGAIYTMDAAVRCPCCQKSIRTVRIIELTRTQVAFMSTLPRKGRVMVCPECEHVLSAELSGLV